MNENKSHPSLIVAVPLFALVIFLSFFFYGIGKVGESIPPVDRVHECASRVAQTDDEN